MNSVITPGIAYTSNGLVRRRAGFAICALVVLCLSLAVAVPVSADTGSGWWTAGVQSRPTSLQPGTATDAIQEVSVSATSGQFSLEREEGANEVVEVAFDAPAGTVQSALEGLYGKGDVSVAEGAGDTSSSHSWVVTFTGGLADQPVAEMHASSVSLAGGTHKASDTVKTPGRADGQIVLSAVNAGVAAIEGASDPIEIAGALPPTVRAVGMSATAPKTGTLDERVRMSCTLKSLTCSYAGEVIPFGQVEVRIDVVAEAAASPSETIGMTVSGGQVSSAALSRPLPVGPAQGFGLEEYEMLPEEEGGLPATQAGSHPFQLTTTLTLDQRSDPASLGETPKAEPSQLVKDINVKLPPGLIGNPQALPRCPLDRFLEDVEVGRDLGDACETKSAVGIASVTVNEPGVLRGFVTFTQPIFNLEPAYGEPARFGFYIAAPKLGIILDASLRSGSGEDYGVTVSALNTTQTAGFLSSTVTFWGTPGDQRHDNVRGWGCLEHARGETEGFPCIDSPESEPPSFQTLPTSCSGPLQSSVSADSWLDQSEFFTFPTGLAMPAMNSCNQLRFAPLVSSLPTTESASSPTGLNFEINFDDEGITAAQGKAQSQVRKAVVTLPEGVVANPSLASGLSACSQAQYESETIDSKPGTGCPSESEIGTVEVNSPLLEQTLTGNVYIASQNANPFGSLLALYVVVKNPETGVMIKLAGRLEENQATGQLTSTFENLPQLPFSHFKLSFRQGQRSPLVTPPTCGTYTTEAKLYPYSEPDVPHLQPATLHIASGARGAPCPSSGTAPFEPSLTAGTINNQAGAFSPLSTTISREDANQQFGSVTLHTPPGLSGMLSSVKLCPEAQANEGTCGPESLIGETTVTAGAGTSPVVVHGGRVYITEKYDGAPFGLSIVNPVKVGPFDLEHDTANPNQNPACDCVVVRAKIEVDPSTAQLTVTTDPTGPHAIPHIIDGIPVQIRKVNVLINRPGFMFNPTDCEPLKLTGAIAGSEGANVNFSNSFQATNCASLKFEPKFAVSTKASDSFNQNGASLVAKVSTPNDRSSGIGQQGTEANIAKVKVELPLALPSRLTTLQKACLASVFATNPAACPAASHIGYAVVHTPLLPVPLEGPAIFVSHGGEAFPSLTIVLQGDGVTIDLVGSTFISRKGVTSTTFKTVPDAPFSTFELTLPQGKYSALAATTDVCKPTTTKTVSKRVTVKRHGKNVKVTKRVSETVAAPLEMPTEMIGQNGAAIHEKTKISVTGCRPAHPKAHKAAKKGRRGKKK